MPGARKEPLVASVIVVYKSADRDFRWSARAANNKVVADSSEGYRSNSQATRMARSLFPGVPIEFR